MKSDQKYVEVQGYSVDVNAVTGLKYRCDPKSCRNRLCCCGVYDVWINAKEKEKISRCLPAASNYPVEGRGNDVSDFLRWIGAGYILRKDKEQFCSLSYRTGDGQVRCSLHSIALDQNISPVEIKPRNCVLWPLSLSGKGEKTLSVQDDAYNFPCCRTAHTANCSLIERGTACLIKENFGERFLSILRRKISQYQ